MLQPWWSRHYWNRA